MNDSSNGTIHPDLEAALAAVRGRVDEASQLAQEQRHGDAAAALRAAEEDLTALPPALGQTPDALEALALVLDGQHVMAGDQGDIAAAEMLFGRSQTIRRTLAEGGAQPVAVPLAVSEINHAQMLASVGRLAEAEVTVRKAIEGLEGKDHGPMGTFFTIGAFRFLTLLLARQKRIDVALTTLQRGVAIGRRAMEEGTAPDVVVAVVQALNDGAQIAFEDGRVATAIELGTEAGRRADALHDALAATQAEPERAVGALQHYVTAQVHLVTFHEAAGSFGEAEDALFRALEIIPGHPQLVEHGRAFYKRALTYDDDALEEGNLPRDEALESLAELEEMASSD